MENSNKKHKIKLLDKYVRIEYYKMISLISVIFALIFIPPIENCMGDVIRDEKIWRGFSVVYPVFLIVSYLFIWFRATQKKSIVLKLNNSKLEVREGDIFTEPDSVWKVIGVNEYFDTLVGGKEQLVAEESLHGKYLKKFYPNGVKDLDERITESLIAIESNKSSNMRSGKNKRYPLGTIFCDENKYLLVAFAKTDEDNRAIISMKDYINFLTDFWSEVDKIYNGCSISIPLFGTGIVRFREWDVSHQELLELIIWSFKNSHINMAYGAKVSILLYGDDIEKVNLYKLKEME